MRSRTVGIPSGRRVPSDLGMNVRRIALGWYVPALSCRDRCSRFASTSFSYRSIVIPSTPAAPLFFADFAHEKVSSWGDVSTLTLIPAYVLSELKTAFLLGFKVYLPFLIIDMVISTVLISMGMMMLPPVLISMPFKLLLFVLVDGWRLISAGLMGSFVS